eukprot:2246631-Amphidinium_carterae.2
MVHKLELVLHGCAHHMAIAHANVGLMLRPQFLNLQDEPLRVIQMLHPSVGQLWELAQHGNVSPTMRNGIRHSVLHSSVYRKVVVCDRNERRHRCICKLVQCLLRVVLRLRAKHQTLLKSCHVLLWIPTRISSDQDSGGKQISNPKYVDFGSEEPSV